MLKKYVNKHQMVRSNIQPTDLPMLFGSNKNTVIINFLFLVFFFYLLIEKLL